jgi:hypothetical protein
MQLCCSILSGRESAGLQCISSEAIQMAAANNAIVPPIKIKINLASSVM